MQRLVPFLLLLAACNAATVTVAPRAAGRAEKGDMQPTEETPHPLLGSWTLEVDTALKITHRIATIATRPNTKDKRLHPYHVYQVKSANPKKKTVTIHNPWNTEKDITLKESELRDQRKFSGYTETDL